MAEQVPLLPATGRPQPMRIGGINVAPPVLLAPMSSLTTLPMRTLCEDAGCGLTITEFLAAPALAAGVRREVEKIQPSGQGRAWGAQIFGRNPDQMARAARLVVDKGASLVDLNMGCPARKVTKGVSGVALMREPELAESLVCAVVETVKDRAVVTVKMRSGWDETSKNAPEFAVRMVQAGAQAVAVHGRTRAQGFAGTVDLDTIARVKDALAGSVPLIGNGDVTDIPSMERMFEVTGCDAVMVGRAALGNPWIFSAFRSWWVGETPPEAPSPNDRMQMYLRHLELTLDPADERRAVVEMRKFASWYLRRFPGASALRKRIYALSDGEAVRHVVWEAMDDRRT